MQPLLAQDVAWCVRRLPQSLLLLLKQRFGQLAVAGGYVRSCVSGEPVADVDVFAPSSDIAEACAFKLAGNHLRTITTANAVTVVMKPFPVQFIHRWTYERPEDILPSFDFTVARAAFWWESATGWKSLADERFYPDLAARRLVYCSPARNEDAGGSMLRVLKFYQRGYRIPLDSLGGVLARLAVATQTAPEGEEPEGRRAREALLGSRLTELLREVDPEVDPSHVAHLPATNDPSKDDIAWAQRVAQSDPSEGTQENLQTLGLAARILDRQHRDETPDDQEPSP